MANETMRIFFPLKIITYPQGEYGLDDSPLEINLAEGVAYEEAILAAIAKENRLFENDRGLAEYIHDECIAMMYLNFLRESTKILSPLFNVRPSYFDFDKFHNDIKNCKKALAFWKRKANAFFIRPALE